MCRMTQLTAPIATHRSNRSKLWVDMAIERRQCLAWKIRYPTWHVSDCWTCLLRRASAGLGGLLFIWVLSSTLQPISKPLLLEVDHEARSSLIVQLVAIRRF